MFHLEVLTNITNTFGYITKDEFSIPFSDRWEVKKDYLVFGG